MKIGIIGGGSIGLLFAYYLNQHHEVILYVRSSKQRDKILSDGLMLQSGGQSFRTVLQAKLVEEWGKGEEDLSIICVKQYQIPDLLKNRENLAHHPLLFVQNGMGHLKWMEKLLTDYILVGSVEHGAIRENENCVNHTGKGLTKIAVFRGKDEGILGSLLDPFQTTFPFQLENDYKEMLIRKLVVNSIINPLTAVLRVENGVLLENPHYFQLFNQLFEEVTEVLQLKDKQGQYENVKKVCTNTSGNRSSMLKDIEEKRLTEVDAILGYLIEETKKREIEAPLIHAFYLCIKGSELEGGK